MKKKKIVIVFIVIVIITILAGMAIWRVYYNQPLHKIELILPNNPGEKESTDFSLPRGGYIIKVENEGELLNDDTTRKIRYKLTLSKEELVIEKEVNINFSHGIKEVWLDEFDVKEKIGQGTFLVELITPGKTAVKAKVIIINRVLFKTVI